MGNRRMDNGNSKWLKHVLPFVVLLLVGFALHGMWNAANLSAAGGGPVGFVDVGLLIDDYLAPMVDAPLTAETLRLQAEFEEIARELDEATTQELFERYQTMLNLVKHDLIEEQLPVVNAAIEAVAERETVTVVLDKQSVLHGGVDLTEKVLDYLRNDGENGDRG